ncbi:hypothetical protein [Neptunicoccus cionae]|uniref:hypothetical protein n=1 Tax=Neptunicoccus cionae TaxID=2035344 RepID=UPI000C77D407|nr:hypothetical protein [Amylibacter cionae]PLS23241.1 hypothetical protein C0U40_03675 [Amylibacter cionae]
MSALTAVILTTFLTTPIVQVSHDRIIETARETASHHQSAHLRQYEFSGATDIGIDDAALNDFVSRANLRYQGHR